MSDCKNCENNAILEVSELTLKLDEAYNHIVLLQKCLKAKDLLCNFLQDKNEELNNKLEIYIEHIKNLKTGKNNPEDL